jgi:hypothetical protein
MMWPARALERLSRALPSELVFFEVRREWPLWATVMQFEANADRLPVGRHELLASPGAYVDRRGTLYVGQGWFCDWRKLS